MPEITTEYDAQVNLTVAREALKKGEAAKLSSQKINLLKRHVKEAETILKKVREALKASKKK